MKKVIVDARTGKPVTRATVEKRFQPLVNLNRKEPEVNQWDFLLGHRYCTYNSKGQPVLHTDDRDGAIRDDSDWAWDNKEKRWIKIPA